VKASPSVDELATHGLKRGETKVRRNFNSNPF